MKRLIILLPLLGLVINSCGSTDKPKDLDYEFSQTQVSNVKFSTGLSIQAFPDGMPLSIGSGLRVESYNPKTGEAILYGMTDRGPNGDAPAPLQPTQDITATKVFPVPEFQPTLLRMSFSPTQGLSILNRIGLQQNGKPITGLPIPAGSIGNTGEIALSEQLKSLSFDPNGIDPEGIDFDRDGNVWICDEYGPFLAKVNKDSGAILAKLAPGRGLPAILAQRQPNRGFEGLAVSDGKIYAVIQSTLDINGQTKKIADFIRLVEFNLTSGATRMFAYPIDAKAYSKTSDAKLGDLLALGNGRFAVIEQGSGADKTMHHVIYGIDLTAATDLTDRKIETGSEAGKDLEYTQLAQLAAQGIQPVRKVLLADLHASGWTQEKAEGLAQLNSKTLMIMSDNDFGLKSSIVGGPSANLDDYKVDGQGTLYYQGAASQGTYQIGTVESATQLMILTRDTEFASF